MHGGRLSIVFGLDVSYGRPHKMHGDHTKCVVITQNTRHFLHEGLAEGKPFMSLFLFEVFLMTEI